MLGLIERIRYAIYKACNINRIFQCNFVQVGESK